jgi:trehalose 6-phosphate synthase
MSANGTDSRTTQLVIASNRPPGNGSGGVSSALSSLSQGTDTIYVASTTVTPTTDDPNPAGSSPQPLVIDTPRGPLNCIQIQLSREQHESHYNRISNPLLWGAQHGLYPLEWTRRPEEEIRDAWREGYLPVNAEFARAIVGALDAKKRPLVMLQDYHLYCVAPWVRRARPEAVITQFIHIPWPAPDAWKSVVPMDIRREMMIGLTDNDIVGFQTDKNRENFLATCVAVLGAELLPDGTSVKVRGRKVEAHTYPISVDVDHLRSFLDNPAVDAERQELAQRYSPSDRVSGFVGRLEPSKNLLGMLRAFDLRLREDPRRAKTDCLEIFANPTREDIPEYRDYRLQVEALVAEIRKRHGDPANPDRPVRLRVEPESMPKAVALMERADAFLVLSLADGMNLFAKDAAILSRHNGVLVLTETCGAHDELGEYAVSVTNPRDVREIATALSQALDMPEDERSRRLSGLQGHITEFNLANWNERQVFDIQVFMAGPEVILPGVKAGLNGSVKAGVVLAG